MKHRTIEEVTERASLYALGALGADEARAFEAHLAEGCVACADEVRSFDSAVASLAACSPEAAPGPAPRERLTASLRAGGRTTAGEATPEPATPAGFVKIRAGEGAWDELEDGVFRKVLFRDAGRGTITSLIRMRPGSKVSPHYHEGVEECVVLEGDIRSDADLFGPGDYLRAPAGSVHEQLFSRNGALLFIVAAGEATI
jgi:anti-sigma factor ChrR (cupin superfamily)